MREDNYLVKLYRTNYIPGKGRGFLFSCVEEGAFIYVIQFFFILPTVIAEEQSHQIVSKRYNVENPHVGVLPEISLGRLNDLNLDPAVEVLYNYLVSEYDGNIPYECFELIETEIEEVELILQLKYRKEIIRIEKQLDLNGCKSFFQRIKQTSYKFSEEKDD